MTDHLGRRLGNYTLTRLLGKGSFAEVYLAEHVYLKSLAAIKVLQTQLGQDDTERFISEARLLMGLRHPHIVRVLEFGVEQDIPFLVMDYAPHGTLRQRYPKGTRLAPTMVATYVRQIASALQYAHNQNLIHRDVKPENLLFHDNDEVLLSDFGIALIAQTSRIQSNQGVIGTATYMAPEQIQGKATVASDQYSLGIIAYEWLSGKSPFQGSFSEVCAQHVMTPPTPLHQTVPMLLPAIEDVVMRTLAKEPGKRFPNVEAFSTTLDQVCQPDQLTQTAQTYLSANLATVPASQDWDATLRRRPAEAMTPSADSLPPMSRDFAQTNPKSTTPAMQESFSFHLQENRSSVRSNSRSVAIQATPQYARRGPSTKLMTILLILAASLIGGFGLLYYALSSQPHQLTVTATTSTASHSQLSSTIAPTTAPKPSPTIAPKPSPTTASQQQAAPQQQAATGNTAPPPEICYQAHVQNIGWQTTVCNGQQAGTTGRNLRIEALRIWLVHPISGMNVCYQAHVQNIGWQGQVCNGNQAGTVGQNLRIEAVHINLVGAPPNWNVCYKAHVQNIGWQGQVCNGQQAGTVGQNLRIEAIQISLVQH